MPRAMIAAAASLIMLGGPLAAQDWPARPITLVVPFAAGGGVDVSARIQAQRMGELLGQQIVVENVGAAAGMAGGQRVAKAAPDGYTLLIGNTGTHAFNQSLYEKPLYNAVTEFEPVGLVSESPRIIIARNDLPANNLQELIAYLKANEKTAQFGSAGVGSGTHLPCVLFNLAIGANVTHAFYFPKGTPEPIVRKLNKAMSDTLDDPAIRKRLEELGLEVVPPERRTPEYLAKYLPAEIERWAKVVHRAGISAD